MNGPASQNAPGSDGKSAIARLWQHMRALWPGYQMLAVAPFFFWPLYCTVILGERRWELIATMVLGPLLAFYNQWSRRLLVAIMPFGFVGLTYEFMRRVQNVGLSVENVHTCDLRGYELALFGVTVDGTRMTLQDYFLTHHWLPADIYFAIPYGTYLFIPVSYAVYLYLRDYIGTLRYMWAFFALNLTGFITYHLYPAAPPWYIHEYGCGVDLTVHASAAAALLRVDEWLGIPWFQGLYGRSSDVFGAVPSLHCAYMYLIVVEAWRQHRWLGRSLALLLFLSTSAAAVYLDHHWVIDIVLGMIYVTLTYYPIRYLFRNVVDDYKPAARAGASSITG